MGKIISKTLVYTLIASLFAALLQITWTPKTQAAYEGGWLIDDAIFLNAKAMNANQIQSFLNSKGSGLATRNFKLQCYGSNSQERQWYTAIGAPCDQTISAAQIIYYTAQVYGINPQVILATLQKEQSLITTKNPTSWQINQAMGYACPTSGNCSGNSTFSYQLDSGVWALRYHYERANKNYNWWSPSYDNYWVCGSSKNLYKPSLYPGQRVAFYDTNGTHYRTHYIKNAATSAMYCYTPHAYNNPQGLYGRPAFGFTGLYYSGSYNFVNSFEAWFGSTQIPWRSLDIPRWMETKVDTYKKNPLTGENIEVLIPAGKQIYFMSKIEINGKTYLRTKHDHQNSYFKGILISDLANANIEYIPMQSPRWMETTKTLKKVDQLTEKPVDQVLATNTQIYFTDKISIGGRTYLRTAHDTKREYRKGILINDLRDSLVEYEAFKEPRWMEVTQATRARSFTEAANTGSVLEDGSHIFFDTKLNVNGERYYRKGLPTDPNDFSGFPSSDFKNIEPEFTPLSRPRAFRVKENLFKKNPVTELDVDDQLAADMEIYFSSKITIGSKTYYRSLHDTKKNNLKGIDSSKLEEVSVSFTPMKSPRILVTNSPLHKLDPVTMQPIDDLIDSNKAISFTDKITINGVTYLRTTHDNKHGYYKVILFSSLRER